MNNSVNKVTKDMFLGEVVQKHPEAAHVMLEYGLHCVGCVINQFETLEQGARVHGMSDEEIDEMLVRINESIKVHQKHQPAYHGSTSIDNEATRLSLMGEIANKDAKKVLETIQKQQPDIKTILDVGCGTGEAFQTLQGVFTTSEIYGIDSSKEALAKARQRKSTARLITGNITKLSETHDEHQLPQFDLTFIRNTLLHITDPEDVLRQMKYATRDGGTLFAQEPNWKTAEGSFRDFVIFKEALTVTMQSMGIDPYMGKHLKEMCERIGLEQVTETSFSEEIRGDDDTWDILTYLLEVVGEKITPFLRERGVPSQAYMKDCLDEARKNPENYFRTPAWIIVCGTC